MYKKRLKQWGVTKTVSSTQKDALVMIAQDCVRRHEALPIYDNRGNAIDWQKVRRRDWEINVRNKLWRSLELPVRPIRTITSREPTYLLVCSISEYFRSQDDEIPGKLMQQRWQMPVLFEDGIRLVKNGPPAQARQKFNDAGVLLSTYLQSVPFSLVPQLLRVVLDLNWKSCPEYRKVVFEYLQKVLIQTKGSEDLLTKFVALLLQQDANYVGREAVWKFVLDSISQRKMDAKDREELHFRFRWALSRWQV